MTKKISSLQNYQSHRTLEEIANMMDVTRERIRQIEAKALRKLRQRLITKGISSNTLEGL